MENNNDKFVAETSPYDEISELVDIIKREDDLETKSEHPENSIDAIRDEKTELEEIQVHSINDLSRDDLEVLSNSSHGLDKEEIELIGLSNDVEARKTYGGYVIKMAGGWLLFVGLILLLVGGSPMFYLSDTVLQYLLVNATATVLGLLVIVLKYIFKDRESKKNS